MGFTVDYWGTNWLLLGVLSGLRACLYQLSSNRQEALKSTHPAPPTALNYVSTLNSASMRQAL